MNTCLLRDDVQALNGGTIAGIRLANSLAKRHKVCLVGLSGSTANRPHMINDEVELI